MKGTEALVYRIPSRCPCDHAHHVCGRGISDLLTPNPCLHARSGHYAWKPADRALTLAVLAQSLGTLRCCSVARDVIILADIFEEEDFYPSTFGFRLTPPVEDESLGELLDLAGGALREKVRAEVSCNGYIRNGHVCIGYINITWYVPVCRYETTGKGRQCVGTAAVR